jgi:hypothetical protein
MTLRLTALLSLAVLLTACSGADTTILDPAAATAAPVDPQKVRIFLDASRAPGKYVEVAKVSAHGDTGDGEDKLLGIMRKKAAKVGANGLIILNTETQPGWPSGRIEISGLAIRYSE